MKDFLKVLPKQSEKIKKFLNKLTCDKLVYFIFFFILLVGFVSADLVLKNSIKNYPILPDPFVDFKVSDYPVFKSGQIINISALGAVVMDNTSKTIVFSKNPNLRFSMASTTKIMTALVALDYYKMDDILTVKTDDVGGSVVGFKKGEKLSFENLLYAMLLPSANDAALAIAENYKGGKEEFIKKMNEKAIGLRLYSTHFADSYGLDDGENYTTVIDLANLASAAIENNIFSKIVSTKTRIISDIDNSNTYLVNNLNKLLGENGVNGIKTGYTDEAGGVLVTSTMQGERKLIIVVMKSEDRFLDTSKLLFDLRGNLNYLTTHL